MAIIQVVHIYVGENEEGKYRVKNIRDTDKLEIMLDGVQQAQATLDADTANAQQKVDTIKSQLNLIQAEYQVVIDNMPVPVPAIDLITATNQEIKQYNVDVAAYEQAYLSSIASGESILKKAEPLRVQLANANRTVSLANIRAAENKRAIARLQTEIDKRDKEYDVWIVDYDFELELDTPYTALEVERDQDKIWISPRMYEPTSEDVQTEQLLINKSADKLQSTISKIATLQTSIDLTLAQISTQRVDITNAYAANDYDAVRYAQIRLTQLSQRLINEQDAKGSLEAISKSLIKKISLLTIEKDRINGLVTAQQRDLKPITPQTTQHQPILSSDERAAFFNKALLPAFQRWKPTHRTAILSEIDYSTDECTITIDYALSREHELKISEEDRIKANVPIRYGTCNSAPFENGDKVIVGFRGDWSTPVVVGFQLNPRECSNLFIIPLAQVGNNNIPHISGDFITGGFTTLKHPNSRKIRESTKENEYGDYDQITKFGAVTWDNGSPTGTRVDGGSRYRKNENSNPSQGYTTLVYNRGVKIFTTTPKIHTIVRCAAWVSRSALLVVYSDAVIETYSKDGQLLFTGAIQGVDVAEFIKCTQVMAINRDGTLAVCCKASINSGVVYTFSISTSGSAVTMTQLSSAPSSTGDVTGSDTGSVGNDTVSASGSLSANLWYDYENNTLVSGGVRIIGYSYAVSEYLASVNNPSTGAATSITETDSSSVAYTYELFMGASTVYSKQVSGSSYKNRIMTDVHTFGSSIGVPGYPCYEFRQRERHDDGDAGASGNTVKLTIQELDLRTGSVSFVATEVDSSKDGSTHSSTIIKKDHYTHIPATGSSHPMCQYVSTSIDIDTATSTLSVLSSTKTQTIKAYHNNQLVKNEQFAPVVTNDPGDAPANGQHRIKGGVHQFYTFGYTPPYTNVSWSLSGELSNAPARCNAITDHEGVKMWFHPTQDWDWISYGSSAPVLLAPSSAPLHDGIRGKLGVI